MDKLPPEQAVTAALSYSEQSIIEFSRSLDFRGPSAYRCSGSDHLEDDPEDGPSKGRTSFMLQLLRTLKRYIYIQEQVFDFAYQSCRKGLGYKMATTVSLTYKAEWLITDSSLSSDYHFHKVRLRS